MSLNKDNQIIIQRDRLEDQFLIAFMKFSDSNFKLSLT